MHEPRVRGLHQRHPMRRASLPNQVQRLKIRISVESGQVVSVVLESAWRHLAVLGVLASQEPGREGVEGNKCDVVLSQHREQLLLYPPVQRIVQPLEHSRLDPPVRLAQLHQPVGLDGAIVAQADGSHQPLLHQGITSCQRLCQIAVGVRLVQVQNIHPLLPHGTQGCLQLVADALVAQAAGLRRVGLGGDPKLVPGTRWVEDTPDDSLSLAVRVDPGGIKMNPSFACESLHHL
mmetsp:Transcript_7070/g.15183  ORF Transcript_7070/g.15183 Transcript_7070/m.15183 type:complete len:234 (-) Transcript_7070:173-874(-)